MRSATYVLTVALAVAGSVAHAADPGPVCESSKLGTTAKYAQCRLKADSKAAKAGTMADYSKCSLDKFTSAETKADGACPTTGDQSGIGSYVDACTSSVAVALHGGGLPEDVVTCNADLAICDADLSTTNADLQNCNTDLSTTNADLQACEARPDAAPLKTQQADCFNSGGTMIACSGTGQDGEFQNGVARSFTDNGNGTVTDNATGLMWEKLSDDGSDHDKDTTYTWTTGVAAKLAAINGANFGGHSDWRLPNLFELQSLVDASRSNPAIDPAFDNNCTASCTPTTCSCTDTATTYWTSTTDAGNTAFAWRVDFTTGESAVISKAGANVRHIRAVRSAS